MTQSLTERLAEQLEEQRAAIESVAASELQRLGASLRTELSAVLASTGSAMAEKAASTTAQVTRDLERLRRVGRWWWGTMAVSWATILALLGSLLWLWMSPPSAVALLSGVGVDPVFTAEGRTYLLLPQGSQALRCQQGRGQWVPCVALPTETRPRVPSLEQSQEQIGAASEASRSEGGRLLWPPAARPMTRPEKQPGTSPGQEG